MICSHHLTETQRRAFFVFVGFMHVQYSRWLEAHANVYFLCARPFILFAPLFSAACSVIEFITSNSSDIIAFWHSTNARWTGVFAPIVQVNRRELHKTRIEHTHTTAPQTELYNLFPVHFCFGAVVLTHFGWCVDVGLLHMSPMLANKSTRGTQHTQHTLTIVRLCPEKVSSIVTVAADRYVCSRSILAINFFLCFGRAGPANTVKNHMSHTLLQSERLINQKNYAKKRLSVRISLLLLFFVVCVCVSMCLKRKCQTIWHNFWWWSKRTTYFALETEKHAASATAAPDWVELSERERHTKSANSKKVVWETEEERGGGGRGWWHMGGRRKKLQICAPSTHTE